MKNFILGDTRFFWPENITYFSHIPSAWDSSLNTGIGINQLNTLWITTYLNMTSSLVRIGISWDIIYFLFWLIPPLLFSFIFSFFLFKHIINEKFIYCFISGIVYSTNTYFLMVFLGGQIGVAFSYSLIPLVFLSFFKLYKIKNFTLSIAFGLILSAQILFDPRLSFLTLILIILFYIINLKFKLSDLLYYFATPFLISLFIHSYWIFPLIAFPSKVVPEGFNSVGGIKFLSFSFLENTISVLHPNWPENIFGKTYFMRPEFIMLPVLAFISLFFISKKKLNLSIYVIYFSIILLFCSFLAKGTNEPFGNVYIWLISKIPGFSIFRDSTKFFPFIALSYSILIPYSLINIMLKLKKVKYINLLPIVFIIFWIFTLRQIFITKLIYLNNEIPSDYIYFKNFIISENLFYRTLWIPQWQRYGYFSDKNPIIGREEILSGSAYEQVKKLEDKNLLNKLNNFWNIKYVVIPYDLNSEIFLKDRKYDNSTYVRIYKLLLKNKNLKEVNCCGKIKVFKIKNYSNNSRFFIYEPKRKINLQYKFKNPSEYVVILKNAKKEDYVLFSENYDSYWEAKYDNKYTIQSREFKINSTKSINSFKLLKGGSYTIKVFYKPQKILNLGIFMSIVTFSAVIFILIKNKNKL